jgi:NAD(P)-dependent dehydrogenase (short-subunit alcohol dehydrogenase family)
MEIRAAATQLAERADDGLFDVAGRRVLVAGGAGGLGYPLARALAGRGAQIMLADLNDELAESRAQDLQACGFRAEACRLDVTQEASCSEAIEATVARLGGLDILLNASGMYRTAPALDLKRRDWDSMIGANLTGAFLLARAAGRIMVAQRNGRIITLASVSSTVVNPEYAGYAASKAGVAHLTRVLALEWAPFGVTVNAIGPAVTPTPLAQPILDHETRRQSALAKIPMGRFGEPDDLIGIVVLLASKAGAFITGQTIFVDGGRTLV